MSIKDLDDLLLSKIISYVGQNQYRFVATLDRRFHKHYAQLFPNDTSTYLNASTLEVAKFCVEELRHDSLFGTKFCSLELAYKRFPWEIFYRLFWICQSAAKLGNLPALDFVLSEFLCKFPDKCCKKELYKEFERICSNAARNGHRHILLYAKENDSHEWYKWNEVTCAAAAENSLEMLQWVRENGCPWNSSTCACAAKSGNFDALKWARENGCPWGTMTCAYAAKSGNMNTLKWARENGCRWDYLTCGYAAANGDLEMLKWARKNGCEWDVDTCENAAREGHLEVLDWAWHHGCPWYYEFTTYDAAQKGHLHILKWAREQGEPWHPDTSLVPAQTGRLDILKWAIENGCPWHPDTCDDAEENGHFELAQWARENGCLNKRRREANY
jgi:hypothetical protein